MKLINTNTTNVYRVTGLPTGATNGRVVDAIVDYLHSKGRTGTQFGDCRVMVKRGRKTRNNFYARIIVKLPIEVITVLGDQS